MWFFVLSVFAYCALGGPNDHPIRVAGFSTKAECERVRVLTSPSAGECERLPGA